MLGNLFENIIGQRQRFVEVVKFLSVAFYALIRLPGFMHDHMAGCASLVHNVKHVGEKWSNLGIDQTAKRLTLKFCDRQELKMLQERVEGIEQVDFLSRGDQRGKGVWRGDRRTMSTKCKN